MFVFLTFNGTNHIYLIFISIIMVFFCLLFYAYIKQMLEKTDKFELILKEILEQLVLDKKEEDRVSLEELSEVSEDKYLEINLDKNSDNVVLNQPLIKEVLDDIKVSSYYEDTDDSTINNVNKIEHISFDLSDFVKKDNMTNQVYRELDNKKDYLKTVSNKMVQELKPQTVELTDYEKEQEEHAVISYKELLSLKDKIDLESTEDDIKFVEDLKNFRNMI